MHRIIGILEKAIDFSRRHFQKDVEEMDPLTVARASLDYYLRSIEAKPYQLVILEEDPIEGRDEEGEFWQFALKGALLGRMVLKIRTDGATQLLRTQ